MRCLPHHFCCPNKALEITDDSPGSWRSDLQRAWAEVISVRPHCKEWKETLISSTLIGELESISCEKHMDSTLGLIDH